MTIPSRPSPPTSAARPRRRKRRATAPLDERLARYIVEGSRDGLIEDLDRKLAEAAPLDIINGPLMRGMDEVGRLFNDNQLIVAEVLQSAEAMKAAVGYLEPFMEKAESSHRGTIVLATVKGDVHDIGKNLVEIILGNNGYRIVNLGIKVPPEELIAAYQPTARRLRPLGTPRQVGPADGGDRRGSSRGRHRHPALRRGAALTRKFTATRIAAEYGGLDALRQRRHGRPRPGQPALLAHDAGRAGRPDPQGAGELSRRRTAVGRAAPSARPARAARADRPGPVPEPPDLEPHVLRDVPLAHIYPYLNLQMLLGKHLGVQGPREPPPRRGRPEGPRIARADRRPRARGRCGGVAPRARPLSVVPRARRRATPCASSTPAGAEAARFEFPRQREGDGLCLSRLRPRERRR